MLAKRTIKILYIKKMSYGFYTISLYLRTIAGITLTFFPFLSQKIIVLYIIFLF